MNSAAGTHACQFCYESIIPTQPIRSNANAHPPMKKAGDGKVCKLHNLFFSVKWETIFNVGWLQCWGKLMLKVMRIQ